MSLTIKKPERDVTITYNKILGPDSSYTPSPAPSYVWDGTWPAYGGLINECSFTSLLYQLHGYGVDSIQLDFDTPVEVNNVNFPAQPVKVYGNDDATTTFKVVDFEKIRFSGNNLSSFVVFDNTTDNFYFKATNCWVRVNNYTNINPQETADQAAGFTIYGFTYDKIMNCIQSKYSDKQYLLHLNAGTYTLYDRSTSIGVLTTYVDNLSIGNDSYGIYRSAATKLKRVNLTAYAITEYTLPHTISSLVMLSGTGTDQIVVSTDTDTTNMYFWRNWSFTTPILTIPINSYSIPLASDYDDSKVYLFCKDRIYSFNRTTTTFDTTYEIELLLDANSIMNYIRKANYIKQKMYNGNYDFYYVVSKTNEYSIYKRDSTSAWNLLKTYQCSSTRTLIAPTIYLLLPSSASILIGGSFIFMIDTNCVYLNNNFTNTTFNINHIDNLIENLTIIDESVLDTRLNETWADVCSLISNAKYGAPLGTIERCHIISNKPYCYENILTSRYNIIDCVNYISMTDTTGVTHHRNIIKCSSNLMNSNVDLANTVFNECYIEALNGIYSINNTTMNFAANFYDNFFNCKNVAFYVKGDPSAWNLPNSNIFNGLMFVNDIDFDTFLEENNITTQYTRNINPLIDDTFYPYTPTTDLYLISPLYEITGYSPKTYDTWCGHDITMEVETDFNNSIVLTNYHTDIEDNYELKTTNNTALNGDYYRFTESKSRVLTLNEFPIENLNSIKKLEQCIKTDETYLLEFSDFPYIYETTTDSYSLLDVADFKTAGYTLIDGIYYYKLDLQVPGGSTYTMFENYLEHAILKLTTPAPGSVSYYVIAESNTYNQIIFRDIFEEDVNFYSLPGSSDFEVEVVGFLFKFSNTNINNNIIQIINRSMEIKLNQLKLYIQSDLG